MELGELMFSPLERVAFPSIDGHPPCFQIPLLRLYVALSIVFLLYLLVNNLFNRKFILTYESIGDFGKQTINDRLDFKSSIKLNSVRRTVKMETRNQLVVV